MSSASTRWIGITAIAAAFCVFPCLALAGVQDGRSPDTRDAALLAHFDGRAPDTLDTALAAHAAVAVADGRSADTLEAALTAHAPLAAATPTAGSSFDWTDAGIGAAGGFAIASALGAALILVQRGGRRKLAA
jgi:hypothetical protein